MTAIAVTEIRFFGEANGNFISYVSAVLGGCLVLKDMRLVKSKKNPGQIILAMPARKDNEGQWCEFYHPIGQGMRAALEKAVFEEWKNKP